MTGIREPAVLGSVGRKRVRLALSDAAGTLRPETIRSYDAEVTTGVSGALANLQRDLELPALPQQSAISVAGLARGDAISVTRTRWFLSRSGLQAMLGRPPLILNDFAAQAWALSSADVRAHEMFVGPPDFSLRGPGCYCVLGMTSGLGSAVVTRSEAGAVTVLATEAGHGGFVAGSAELAALATELFPNRHPVMADELISAPGLVLIYQALARRERAPVRARTPEEVTRAVSIDPIALQACELLCKAFWSQAGSLAVTYGAWDGMLVTGALAGALRPLLRRADLQALFWGTGKYARVLQGVPRGIVSMEHGELVGVAEALRHG